MQTEAPEVFDLSKEPKERLNLYVVSGGGGPEAEWDAHTDIEENHLRMASWTDKPAAALIQDLKRRGMSDKAAATVPASPRRRENAFTRV
jgi:hypothetical protein